MRVATDIGGTFTDLVYLDEETGEVGLAKVSTTPPAFEQGVLLALERSGVTERGEVDSFVHGTTVIINTLTERTGATTALLTTRGFRDVLEIGRANRPDLYNLRYRKPEPFVPRALRLEVDERLDYHGDVLRPLVETDVLAAAERARAAGAEAIAICFLHAYANPVHELRAKELLAEAYPDLFVTASHEVSGEWREYERSSTAVLNAYVQHRAATYLGSLEDGLDTAGVRERLHVMQSNGGITSFRRAKLAPIQLVESGPVAGVMGAATIGGLIGIDDVIALDIGGTTAKTSLITGGVTSISTDYRIEWTPESPGYPIKVPVVDIVEIGTGGGSIAAVNDIGALSVGPRSAGAMPGPACYPDGSLEPTLTDANLISGRIDPANYLGGQIDVSLERARTAMGHVADRLGVSIDEAAAGVIRLANANMISAIKLVSVRKGHDPRDFAMVAFGGGGSLHAAALAAELGISTVVIPPAPSHFSAWGMLMTDIRNDVSRTHVTRFDTVEPGALTAAWEELEARAVEELVADGLAADTVVCTRSADVRYAGQEHSVRVPVEGDVAGPAELAALAEEFHMLHEQHFTFRLDTAVELVTFHVTAFGAVQQPQIPRIAESDDLEPARRGSRLVDFGENVRHETAVFDRALLGAGATASGPAIVEDPAATTVVLPGQTFAIDELGNVVIAIDRP